MSAVFRKEQISIKDIARTAHVSHSTVSRALRNSPLVNPATAERIRKIAAESNFRPSAVGRSLATGRTYTIGVVVASLTQPFVAEVLAEIEEVASQRGYSVILASSRGNPEREMAMVQQLEERRVDGVLLIASRVRSISSSLLAEMHIPMVSVDNQQAPDEACSVFVDNTTATHAAIRFLAHLGHRRIAYLGDRLGYDMNTLRHDGYRAALELLGIAYDPRLVVEGDSDAEGGMRAMERLLSVSERPTAVFCFNDMTALGALAAIYQRQLCVPRDLSVVGFDDLPIAAFTQPPLTTVRQPRAQIGRIAADTLFAMLTGGKIDRVRALRGELIVRESTAPPATDPDR
jgi:DNA-binding LacI/PurR family transcriptional regulator